jgi:BMFP domain-containing protein YqiC
VDSAAAPVQAPQQAQVQVESLQQQVASLVAQLQRLQQQHRQEVATRDEMLLKCRRVILALESRLRQQEQQQQQQHGAAAKEAAAKEAVA